MVVWIRELRFCWQRLDKVPSGKVLDFGCGAGVISAYINTLPGEHDITLVDCDALALASSTKTMSATGSESFSVLPAMACQK